MKNKKIPDLNVGKITYNSCVYWAFYHWFRYGGYLLLRRARSIFPYPHFMWKPKEGSKMYHFVPVKNLQLPWPIFKGYVKEGDWKVGELEKMKVEL